MNPVLDEEKDKEVSQPSPATSTSTEDAPEYRSLSVEDVDQERADQVIAENEQLEAASSIGTEKKVQEAKEARDVTEPQEAETDEQPEKEGNALRTAAEAAFVAPIAVVDFALDAVGIIPGLGFIDDAYDEATKFENETLQSARGILSIVLPSIGAAVATGGAALPAIGSAALRGAVKVGLVAAADVAITGVSDQSEKDETLLTFLDETGIVDVPDALVTLDSDSPEVRRRKNMLESAGLSVVGDLIGYAVVKANKLGYLDWFKPKSKEAQNALDVARVENGKDVSKAVDGVIDPPPPSTMGDGLEETVQRAEASRSTQVDEIATQKIAKDADNPKFDPDVTPEVTRPGSTARTSIPDMAVQRNAADIAAKAKGIADGDANKFMTESQMKLSNVDDIDSRSALSDLADELNESGEFDAVIGGVRITRNGLNEGADAVAQNLVDNASFEEISLFIGQGLYVKGIGRGITATTLDEETANVAKSLIRPLLDRRASLDTQRMAARAIETSKDEVVSTIKGAQEFAEFADPKRTKEQIDTLLKFIMKEHAVFSYLNGSALEAMKRAVTRNADEVSAAITSVQTKASKSADELVSNLDKLSQSQVLRIYEGMAIDPNVKSWESYLQLVKKETSPMGLLHSGSNGGMNLFAEKVFKLMYANVLSGVSSLKAIVGDGLGSAMSITNTLLGAGLESVMSADFKPLAKAVRTEMIALGQIKKSTALFSSTLKKGMKDKEYLQGLIRADIPQKTRDNRKFLEGALETAHQNGDWGTVMSTQMALTMDAMADWPALRAAGTIMTSADLATGAHQGMREAVDQAQDVLIKQGKKIDNDSVMELASGIYAKMFDSKGLLKENSLAKYRTGEIALNLDNNLASSLTQMIEKAPILKTMLMFPRTGLNAVSMAMSYTPLAAIPGMSRYGKILSAGNNQDKIAIALKEHGLNFETMANPMKAYKNLLNEYRGRLVFSSMATMTMWSYAMNGNIRGNGPRDYNERRQLKTDINYEPKTINIGGNWVSYQGVPGLDPILTMLGDMAMYSSDIESPTLENWLQKVMWTVNSTFLDQTFLSNLKPIIEITGGNNPGSAIKRQLARNAGSLIPGSGALNVAARAIDQGHKDTYDDFRLSVLERIPFFRSLAPEKRDIWTGKPITNVENPLAGAVSAASPIPFYSGKPEEWRQQLVDSGVDISSQILNDPAGNPYSPEERSLLIKYIGEQQPWKEVKRVLNLPGFKADIERYRKARDNWKPGNEPLPDPQSLPVNRKILQIIGNAKDKALKRLQSERPELFDKMTETRRNELDVKLGRFGSEERSVRSILNYYKE